MRQTAVLFMLVFLYGAPALAQTMTEVEPLTFGRFAIRDNDSPHSIVIGTDNSVVYDPEMIEGDIPAQRGEYLLEDFPPDTLLTLGDVVYDSGPPSEGGYTLEASASVDGGGGPSFTFEPEGPATVSTDGDGEAILYLGGTLTTSGSSVDYEDGGFSGNFDLTFFFE